MPIFRFHLIFISSQKDKGLEIFVGGQSGSEHSALLEEIL